MRSEKYWRLCVLSFEYRFEGTNNRKPKKKVRASVKNIKNMLHSKNQEKKNKKLKRVKKKTAKLSIIFHRHSSVATPKMLAVNRMHSKSMIRINHLRIPKKKYVCVSVCIYTKTKPNQMIFFANVQP